VIKINNYVFGGDALDIIVYLNNMERDRWIKTKNIIEFSFFDDEQIMAVYYT